MLSRPVSVAIAMQALAPTSSRPIRAREGRAARWNVELGADGDQADREHGAGGDADGQQRPVGAGVLDRGVEADEEEAEADGGHAGQEQRLAREAGPSVDSGARVARMMPDKAATIPAICSAARWSPVEMPTISGSTAAPAAEIGEITLIVPIASARYRAPIATSCATPAPNAGRRSSNAGVSKPPTATRIAAAAMPVNWLTSRTSARVSALVRMPPRKSANPHAEGRRLCRVRRRPRGV